MDPITILALANGALSMVEMLAPKIAELFSKGEITAEQQQLIKDRYAKLHNGGQFDGPEWKTDATAQS